MVEDKYKYLCEKMGKKILIFIFSITLAFSLFPTAVKANAIWIRTPFVYTDFIYEVDELKGNDLFTDMVIKLFVSKNATIYSKNVTIEIEPWFNLIHGNPEINNITVCNTSQGIGVGYTYGSVNLFCEDYVEDLFIEEKKTSYPYPSYPSYVISIPIEKFDLYSQYYLRIQYTIPNFVLKEGTVPFLREFVGNNLLVFYSTCQPSDMCKVENWKRFILLPSERDILGDVSGNVRMREIYKGRWVLEMDGGEKSFIRYHDSWVKEFVLPLFFTLLGFFLSFLFEKCLKIKKRFK
jgi:hypothetical protein